VIPAGGKQGDPGRIGVRNNLSLKENRLPPILMALHEERFLKGF